MSDFPKMLYREGSAIRWEGHDLDTLTVLDAGDMAAARGDGWLTAAEVLDGETAEAEDVGGDILAALAMLETDNDDHWTAQGLPSVAAVSELTGTDVTRAQIKAVAPDARRPD